MRIYTQFYVSGTILYDAAFVENAGESLYQQGLPVNLISLKPSSRPLSDIGSVKIYNNFTADYF